MRSGRGAPTGRLGHRPGQRGHPEGRGRVAWALAMPGKPRGLSFAVPECNSLGLAMMGAPAAWRRPSTQRATATRGRADRPGERSVQARGCGVGGRAFWTAPRTWLSSTTWRTPPPTGPICVLPAGTFAESDGTLRQQEGRAQRFYQVFGPPGSSRRAGAGCGTSWRLPGGGPAPAGRTWTTSSRAMVTALPGFAGRARVAPAAAFRVAG